MTEGTIEALVSLGVTKKTAIEVGNRLRAAREARGQTTASVAARIRVREHYLVAMESGEWEILPAGVNGRGLIRIYARDLNVSVAELEHQTVGGASEPSTQPVTTPPSGTRQESVKVRARTAPPSQRPRNDRPSLSSPRSKGPHHVDLAGLHGEEDDEARAIDASSPELAGLLGIPAEKHVEPAEARPVKREVVLENDVPVVRADLLAEEMFMGAAPISEHRSEPPPAPRVSEPEAAPRPTEETISQTYEERPPVESEPESEEDVTRAHAGQGRPPQVREVPTSPREYSTALPRDEKGSVENEEREPSPAVAVETIAKEPEAKARPQEKQTEAPAEAPATPVETRFIPLPDEGIVSPPTPVTKAPGPQSTEPPTSSPLLKWILAAAVILLALGGFALIKLQGGQTADEAQTAETAALEADEAPASSGLDEPAPTPAPQETPVAQASPDATIAPETAAATPAPTAAPEPVTLRKATLKVLGSVELTVRVDGKQIYSGARAPGTLEIEFQKTADIYVEDGSKVSLDYAGWENHGSLGWPGRKRRVVLNAQSYAGQGAGTL